MISFNRQVIAAPSLTKSMNCGVNTMNITITWSDMPYMKTLWHKLSQSNMSQMPAEMMEKMRWLSAIINKKK